MRKTRTELKDYRNKLAERLSQYKDLWPVPDGMASGWSSCGSGRSPRTTADRYIAKWKLSQAPKPLNRTTGAIYEPSKQKIAEMVKKVKVKIEPVLTTPESIAVFMADLAAAIQSSTSVP